MEACVEAFPALRCWGMCLTRRSTHTPEQSPNPEHFRDEGRLAFSINLFVPVEWSLGSLLMDLETPHAVAKRYRKLLINAQTWQFCPGVSCQHHTTPEKRWISVEQNQLRLTPFQPDPDKLESHSCKKHGLQTAHSNAAAPPRAQSLGFREGTWYTCTENASKPR
jgi:hypothetical protein